MLVRHNLQLLPWPKHVLEPALLATSAGIALKECECLEHTSSLLQVLSFAIYAEFPSVDICKQVTSNLVTGTIAIPLICWTSWSDPAAINCMLNQEKPASRFTWNKAVADASRALLVMITSSPD